MKIKNNNFNRTLNIVFDKKYLIFGALFAVLLLLNVNFSSIHMWDVLIENGHPAFTLGHFRGIRSDEFATNLTWQMSQVFNHFGTFNYMSRASGLNTIVAQFQAGWNIENIGRPINWGFLLFGAARGLSWYWCSKLILLFLSSVEFIYLLTKNKNLSLVGAFVITYAPGLQWWFSNYTPELITSVQFIIVLFMAMLNQTDVRIKFLQAIGITVFSIGFAFVLYPPLQIPMFYVMATFVLTILITHKPSKLDIGLITFIILINLICVAHFYLISHEDIKLVMNTIYPGQRFTHSGDTSISATLNYFNNLITPYKYPNYSNQCELSNFWLFFPVFPFLCFLIPAQKRGLYFNLIFYLNLCLLAFLIIPGLGNDYIYKYTLLSKVTGGRAVVIFGLLNTYLLILFIDKYKSMKLDMKTLLWVNAFVWLYVSVYIWGSQIYSNMHLLMYVSVGIMWLIIHLILIHKEFLAIALLVCLTVVSGAIINPIVLGVGDLYDSDLSHKIQEIRKQEPEAVWAATDESWYGEYLLAQGLYSYTAVKFYPDFKVWDRIDKNHKFVDVYNRYAHINFNLVDEKTTFVLNEPDLITLNLNRHDLINGTDIKYVLASHQLKTENNLELLDVLGSKYIYKVIR
jgi:hypothetical protein